MLSHPRRIAFVDLGVEFTGGQSYLKNLASLLSNDSEIWLLKLSPKLRLEMGQRNAKVVDLGFSLSWGRPLQILLCMGVLSWLKFRHRLDVVWVNGYPEIALVPWARVIGCQAVATRHLILLADKPRWHWIRNGWRVHFLYELLAPLAHKIVCVSEAVADSLQKFIRPERLAIIQNWVPILPTVSPCRGLANPLRLLFVGRLTRHKGVSLLLDAMRRLKEVNGLPALSLTVVGEGEDRESLEIEARSLQVRFAGFQTEIGSFYEETDVFVNPTLGPEGLPLVSLDAMSYGLPCIFSDLPAHREISSNGKAVLLFESGNPEDLKRTIQLLIESPQLLIRYGRLAREAVESSHRPELARQRYVEELGL